MAIRNYFYCMLCILSKEKLEINKSINLLQFILSQIFFFTHFSISALLGEENYNYPV